MSDNSLVKGKWKYGCNIKKKERKKLALIISLLFLVKAKVSQDCFIIMQNFLSTYHYHQCAIKFIISWNENDFFEFIIAVSSDKYAVIFWSWSMYYINFFFLFGWIECVVVQFYILFPFVSNSLSYITIHNNKRK